MSSPFQTELSNENQALLAKAIAALPIFQTESGRQSFVKHFFQGYSNATKIQERLEILRWEEPASAVARHLVRMLDGCELETKLTALALLQAEFMPRSSDSVEPAANPTFEGKIIDGYLVGQRLGSGGQAVVHRAIRQSDGQEVALKFLVKTLYDSEAQWHTVSALLKEVLREVDLKNVGHPRVLQPLDKAGLTEDGQLYYPLRLMRQSLRDFLNASQTLTVQTVVQIVYDLADALEAVHPHFTHQDLKPENILLDDRGRVHIADWGLAQLQDHRHSPAARRAAAGTWRYMAPEVFQKFYWLQFRTEPPNNSIDARADLYSLGLIFYELLTGRYAFGNHNSPKDAWEARKADLKQIPQSPDVGRHGIPSTLAQLCQHCLHPEINERVQSAKLLKASLAQFLTLAPNQGTEKYLTRLLAEIEQKARLYSPLRAFEQLRPSTLTSVPRRLEAWKDNPHIALVRHHRRAQTEDQIPEPVRDYDDILTAFQGLKAQGPARRAVLLGAPGSGKSTTLQRLAAELAVAGLADETAPLPILLPLGNWTGDESIETFQQACAPELAFGLETLWQSRRLVLLLDGLNEVPTARRLAKTKQIREWMKKLSDKVDLVVSCREEDYSGELTLDLDTLTLQPLTPQRVRSAVHQWVANCGEKAEVAERFFWQLAGHPDLRFLLKKWQQAALPVKPEEIEELFWTAADPSDCESAYMAATPAEDQLWRNHVPNPSSLLKLAKNPFMLTMLYNIWGENDDLPSNRGELFELFVMGLFSREGLLSMGEGFAKRIPTAEGAQLLRGLKQLAWQMQRERARGGGGEDFGVLTVVGREEAASLLGGEEGLKKALDGTLLEGSLEIKYRHQLLQEYFTAVAMQERMGKMAASDLWPRERWWARSGWEEATVLLAGLAGEDCSTVIRWLMDGQPEVAAKCLLESGAEVCEREGLLKELQAAWKGRLVGPLREKEPEGRAAVGRAMGRLGLDLRKGVGLRGDGVPDIDWVQIPGGTFKYQGKREALEEFEMARYLVTNAQWEAFLMAEDGYANKRWWAEFTEPQRHHSEPAWSEENSPRENVSWQEAVTFSRWLQERLKGQRPEKQIRLGTEREWERAAGGPKGKEYPWGKGYREGYANIAESSSNEGRNYLARTSAVGIYQEGASEEGVLDLSGNLWEWCLNEYVKPENTGLAGAEWRALRGGSWYYRAVSARAGYRDERRPRNRYNDLGFRLVRSSPIR